MQPKSDTWLLPKYKFLVGYNDDKKFKTKEIIAYNAQDALNKFLKDNKNTIESFISMANIGKV